VKVWIDYNNDGSFNTANEQVFSDYSYENHNGTIFIPTTAVLNTPLRMRVASDWYSFSNSCSFPNVGQIEDYAITILPNTNPPFATFSANTNQICNGVKTFSNSTLNASNYTWYFGDGSSSTLKNPTHTYTASGVYSVSLTACNSYGCNTQVKTNFVTVNLGGPISASCSPPTSYPDPNYGIRNVSFNTINYSSAGGTDGYQDYSCAHQTTVTAATNYSIFVKSGTWNSEYVKVWIDYNNDGAFNTANEQVFSDYSYENHNGTFTIPATAVLNTPLRMRVASDLYGFSDACPFPIYGQMEDYAITILPNTNPPIASFTTAASISPNCNGVITFSNSSFNGTTFIWYFGDGSSSTLENPIHTYTANGVYSVSLTACNSNGCNTQAKTNFITITGGPISASCSPQTYYPNYYYGVRNVSFNTINYNSAGGSDGYQDYSCTQQTTVTAATNYSIYVRSGPLKKENVLVWIDYNNDGAFNRDNELVFFDTSYINHSGIITIPSNAVLNKPLRMRVASDPYNPYNDACSSPFHGQIEDYAITILPENKVGLNYSINGQLKVYPNPSNDILNIEYKFEGEKEVLVNIYNMLGEKIFEEQQKNTSGYKKSLNVSNYPSGNYLIRVISVIQQTSRIFSIIH
jgi:PKD repeat protein